MKKQSLVIICAVLWISSCYLTLIAGKNIQKVKLIETAPQGSLLDLDEVENALEILPDLFKSAQKTIDIAAFYMLHYKGYSKGTVVEQLYDGIKRASKRGVEVRILLDYRTFAENEGYLYKQTPQNLAQLPNIKVKLIDLRQFSYYDDGSMHAKYLVIDSTTSFIGSHNWSYGALTDNREVALLVESPIIAKDLLAIFQTDWEHGFSLEKWANHGKMTVENLEETSRNETPRTKNIPDPLLPTNADTTLRPDINWMYVVESSPAELDNPEIPNTEEVILKLIDDADSLIELEVNTFSLKNYLHDGPGYTVVDEALRAVAKRGVKVRLLVDGWYFNMAENTFTWLNSFENVEVRSIDIREAGPNSEYGTVHSKMLIIDAEKVFIGSSTYSQGQILECRNVGIALESTRIGKQCHALFIRDWNSRYARKGNKTTENCNDR